MELESFIGGKACRPYCEFKAGKNKSNFEESLRSFFPSLTKLFCIPVVRASVSNFKQLVHERSKYIVTEALI